MSVTPASLLSRPPRKWKIISMLAHYGLGRGAVASVANLSKGALGGGVLAAHVAYMTAGFMSSIFLNIGFGIYMGVCFYILVQSNQMMCRRVQTASMTYSDLGEAAFALHPNTTLNRFSSCVRYFLDFIVCLHCFGSCCAYQLIVAKTIKQLAENTDRSDFDGLNDMPSLRFYIAIMIIPTIMICLITQLKYLAPFSIVANGFVAIAIFVAIYYAMVNNPGFQNMVPFTSFTGQIQYVGMGVYSMSCAGVVIPVESNLKDPKKIKLVMVIGYVFIISCVFCSGFFGYVGYLDNCKSPITINFPMVMIVMVLKALIALVMMVTHALNFYMPFHNCFFYIKKLINNPNHLFKWELILRALFVTIISIISILFPSIDAIMGFLGSFCLSNMAFIWPNTIYVLVCWERPGMGKYSWRVWRAAIFLAVGAFVFVCGTWVNGCKLIASFNI